MLLAINQKCRKWTKKKPLIGVDFDGTIVQHAFPHIGDEIPGAFEWMRRFVDLDARLVLWTLRTDTSANGEVLKHAVEYCAKQGVVFDPDYVNVVKGQHHWSDSPKVHVDILIDDSALGCPLLPAGDRPDDRPYADWSKIGPPVEEVLIERLLALKMQVPLRQF